MHKIRFALGLDHRPNWGAYSTSSDTLPVFKGSTSKRRREGREGKRPGPPNISA